MISPSTEAVLCDLDGTLVDSVPDLAIATALTLQELGHAHVGEFEVRNWVGDGARALVQTALANTIKMPASSDSTVIDEALLDAAMARFLHHYEAHLTDKSRLYDGVAQTLNSIADRGLALGCVSNKPERLTRLLLQHFDLDRYFSVTVGGDSLATKKPDPEPLLYASKALRCDASKALLVGDSVNDTLAAQRAGMRVVCVSYGYHCGIDLSTLGATAVIGGFAELLEHL